MRGPSPRMFSEVCRQFRPNLGRDARGGHTFTAQPRVQAGGEPDAGFACSFKFTGVVEMEFAGGSQPVQTYFLVAPDRDLRAGDLIDCPGRFGGMRFMVGPVAWPQGGGLPGGVGGFVTATCTAVQPVANQG